MDSAVVVLQVSFTGNPTIVPKAFRTDLENLSSTSHIGTANESSGALERYTKYRLATSQFKRLVDPSAGFVVYTLLMLLSITLSRKRLPATANTTRISDLVVLILPMFVQVPDGLIIVLTFSTPGIPRFCFAIFPGRATE